MLPDRFQLRMQSLLGEEYDEFIGSMKSTPPVSVRLNPFKKSQCFPDAATIPWCEEGRYLSERPVFTLDPMFHAGCYYVQEASSMFIEQAFKAYSRGSQVRKVLDLCAAPGGKSTHLRSIIPDDAILVCNEVIQSRNAVLAENVSKWGHPGVVITRNATDSIVDSSVRFDVVLVDAPCSGEGLFRKDPEATTQWSVESVHACSLRQKSILDAAVRLLVPGGLLIYSTCTWSEEEDEKVVEHLLTGHKLQPMAVPIHQGVIRAESGCRFYPHRIKGEGFFISALLKVEEFESDKPRTRTAAVPGKPVKPEYFRLMGDFDYRMINDRVRAYPDGMMNLLEELNRDFHIVNAGCIIGESKGDSLIPSQDLAQSIRLDKELSSVDLSMDDALRYLRGDALTSEPALKGWQIMKFNGQSLGWAKAVNGRFNNNYPKERRIRMSV